jgi:hypothetical protein
MTSQSRYSEYGYGGHSMLERVQQAEYCVNVINSFR